MLKLTVFFCLITNFLLYAGITESFYNENADSYAKRTLEINMEKGYSFFEQYLTEGCHILDAGSGSGRDTKYFLDLGYSVTGFDASEELAKISSELTGQETLCLRFQDIDFYEKFDAIWASASLLHVPSDELPEAMAHLRDALKPDGIWMASFKYGDFEGIFQERFFNFQTEESLQAIIDEIGGLEIVEVRIAETYNKVSGQQAWLEAILKKTRDV